MQIWPAEDQAATTVQLTIAHFSASPTIAVASVSSFWQILAADLSGARFAYRTPICAWNADIAHIHAKSTVVSCPDTPTLLSAPAHTSTCSHCTYVYMCVCLREHEHAAYLLKQIFMRICILALCQSVSGKLSKIIKCRLLCIYYIMTSHCAVEVEQQPSSTAVIGVISGGGVDIAQWWISYNKSIK